MKNRRGSQHSLPTTQRLTIIAQDPSVRLNGRILTTEIEIPAEEILAGPCGYRVHVVDYDSTSNVLYQPASYQLLDSGSYKDPFKRSRPAKTAAQHNDALVGDPRFHSQNAYAIAMRILARFEFALGRRTPWGSQGHQLYVAPHAFADANAFYSKQDRGLFFGYFAGDNGKPVYACLSHDVVAHETTHALLDGLRGRFMEPSSPDQAAFHEGFADVVALLSVFSLKDLVEKLIDGSTGAARLIDQKFLEPEALKESVLFGLADQMGAELSNIRGKALRRSVELAPGRNYAAMPEFQEPHRRGELLVAAIMNAFLTIWLKRLDRVGFIEARKRDRSLVIDEGAAVAEHLLTMTIRALDYCPPTDLAFSDYLSALLTIDREVVPDDSRFNYREVLVKSFGAYGIVPDKDADKDGTWRRCDLDLVYSRTHFDSMLRDKEEVFRFLWENRKELDIVREGYVEVENVRPSFRVGPDGFILRETVAEYVQIMTLQVGELKEALDIDPPKDMPHWRRVQIFGGGALIFNEYGQLKYQIRNRIEDAKGQSARLKYLWESGYFDRDPDSRSHFAALHLARAMD
ncbi:hypothetical protein KMZ68_17125 [Bradyrhizobium sediminis]|uniref:Peptidase M4 n=1 Tax=Bradyrhizobium sediminis TaxID=2840469 RepID=A0A975RRH8_9BRAD|nr:hypothetical protein [Bradyrhizobium sediminis]QWG16711.1 hypothetical protein KMZ68_17125 [Bradyrhizobium sediminis]